MISFFFFFFSFSFYIIYVSYFMDMLQAWDKGPQKNQSKQLSYFIVLLG